MNDPAVPRILKANVCDKLEILILLDSDSSTLLEIEELIMHSPAAFDMSLEGPSRFYANIFELSITPTCSLSFDPFVGLESLALRINKYSDVKRGQLASLVRLKELCFWCNSILNGLFFKSHLPVFILK
jgi:hypothetical protein